VPISTFTAPAVRTSWPAPALVLACCLGLAGTPASAAHSRRAPAVTVTLSPGSATLRAGYSALFTAKVANTSNQAVSWYVDGVANGSAQAGTILGSGATVTYTAPAAAGSHTVKAVSAAAPSRSGSAGVTVTVPVTVPAAVTSIQLNPASVTLTAGGSAQFSAVVAGTGAFSPAVTWSAQRGAISGTGLYLAPAAGGADVVTATSVQTPSVSASASATVAAPGSSGAPGTLVPVAAPVLSGPVEVQAQGGPYSASASAGAGLQLTWTITGGVLVGPATGSTVLFQPGTGPFATLACTASSGSASASAQRTLVVLPFAPRNYLADLKGLLATYQSSIAAEVASGDPATYYNTSYYLQGMAAAAQGTGDPTVMATLVGYVGQMIAKAQPLVRKGVTYQEWGPWDGNGNPQQLNTFQATAALARTAAVIAGNPAFKAQYATQLNQIVAFVHQSIFLYWFDKQNGIYADPGSPWLGGDVPWLAANLGGWGEYAIWNDNVAHLGMMAAWMYQATGQPLYLEYANRIAQGWRSHAVTINGCGLWDYGIVTGTVDGGSYEYNTTDHCFDTSHANREPMMLDALCGIGAAGVAVGGASASPVTRTDLTLCATTLNTLIWNGSTSNPMFNNYIDGGNEAFGGIGPWEDGNVFLGWDELGLYSAQSQLVLAITYQDIMTGSPQNLSLTDSANSTSYGKVEMAGILARNANQ